MTGRSANERMAAAHRAKPMAANASHYPTLVQSVNDNEVPESACPFCGAILDIALWGGDGLVAPYPGAFSICVHCGSFSVFDDDMMLRRPNPNEETALAFDSDAIAARDKVRQMGYFND